MANSKEMMQLKAVEEKLGELLADNNLVYAFRTTQYPISLTVSQDKDPSAQMELYCTDAGDVSARDARLDIIFQDGEIVIRTDSRLVISDSILSKIKGYAKKMHYLYLQEYFRACGSANEKNSQE